MGLANPIGKILKSSDEYNGSNEFTIIGVVKDMVKEDPFQETMPAIMFLREKNLPWMFVKLSSVDNMSTALEKIEAVFKKVAPSAPFDYKFMDEAFDTKFKAEIRLGKLATFFTIIAIFISCLGLFGLIAYIAEKKTKEIGIRKVLGASVFQMWQLLSKDFIVLIILSCAIAIPVSYYFMQYGEKIFQEDNIVYADSNAFDMFSWRMLDGNPKTALNNPSSIVLTEKLAQKFFGNENPVGKTLIMDGDRTYQVTGLMENVPTNSHFSFDALVSMDKIAKIISNTGYKGYISFESLSDGKPKELVAQMFNDFKVAFERL